MKGVRSANNLRKTVDRIENRSTDLRERIEALKRKIKQTRQYASSVSLSFLISPPRDTHFTILYFVQ